MRISKKLKEYRIEHNLTQLEMAHKIGLSITTYNRLENGESNVYTTTVDKLAQFLSMDVVAVRKGLK